MLKQRILTAVLLAPIVLLIIWYGNDLVFSLFTSLLALLIAFEWCQIVRNNKVNSWIISISIALSIFLLKYASFIVIDVQRILISSLVLWIICFLWLLKPEQGKNKLTIKYALAVGIIMLFGASLISIHQLPEKGVMLTLVLFMLVWIADIGAYIAGKSFGKHKLAKKVSPGKTIEGFLGGILLACILMMLAGNYLQWSSEQMFNAILVTILITIVSVIGDLSESMFKRQAGVKDSGHILPGHGGILDRIDSLTATTPIFALCYLYFGW
ncbi:MAG: phosphatidate cytidylyltransferase [Alcanivoracaceae bacterium]|nr:phosphatidate cytidylyltransferase [Alcanivoracaceae bacterium]